MLVGQQTKKPDGVLMTKKQKQTYCLLLPLIILELYF